MTKTSDRKRRYLDRKKVEKFGPESLGQDMRGRHGHHATGSKNARSKGGRFVTSHGYIAVRVPVDHPHAWGADSKIKYAYEHILVVEAHLGRSLTDDEVVHHGPLGKQVNQIGNLEVKTRSAHAKHHDKERGRDALGRFPPEDLRIREFPKELSHGT